MDLRSNPKAGGALDPSIASVLDHLPDGLLALAGGYWRQAETLLAASPLDDASMQAWLTTELTAPLLLEPSWPSPMPPRPVAGGWVHCDILDDELATFEAATKGRTELGPEGFARFCQELRFPVVPYRRAEQATCCDHRLASGQGTVSAHPKIAAQNPNPAEADRQPLAGRLVIDLSTHWAGPLCTRLLSLFGASVVKIHPECRPDGFSERPNLFHYLNGTKQQQDFDLRDATDRASFERLLVEADLLVESFSRRVMVNLGYSAPELWKCSPRVAMLSFKAFPAGSPEQDWLAYGPGVHAASGLAFLHHSVSDQSASGRLSPRVRPRPAALAYPDVLAGLAGFVAALELLDSVHEHREVSLAEATAPLLTMTPLGRAGIVGGRP